MGIPPSIHAFWRSFTFTIGHDPSDRFYEAFHFDDNAPSADELAALVLALVEDKAPSPTRRSLGAQLNR